MACFQRDRFVDASWTSFWMEIPPYDIPIFDHDCCFIACSGSHLGCARNFEVRFSEEGFKLCLRLIRCVVHRWQLRPTRG